jgi:hypothetical protein
MLCPRSLSRLAPAAALVLSASAAHAAPETFELVGAAGDLQFPGDPLTTEEAQELVQKFAGDCTLELVYDAEASTEADGGFRYESPAGPAFDLVVKDHLGATTFSFSSIEYRLFLADDTTVDTLFITPFLSTEAPVTLSSGTTLDVEITLVLNDASATALSSSTELPAELDLTKLNIRGYQFIFFGDGEIENGRVTGAFAVRSPQAPAECGNGIVEGDEECDDQAGCCTPACELEADGTGCSDADVCTLGDTCQAGACVGGTSALCNTPPGECYQAIGSCGAGGCTYAPEPGGTPCGSPSNTTCDDPDTCDGSGTCDPHPAVDGTPCSDSNACTSGDSCTSGVCAGTPLLCQGQPVTICGTSGKNTITGTGGPDVIDGLDGNDTIYGGGGDDRICGGDGWDELFGEAGNDSLNGGSGFDRCNGGSGSDSGQSCEINNP